MSSTFNNSLNNGNKLIWWILGITATGFFFVALATLNKMNNMDTMITDNRLKVNTLEGKVKQLEDTANMTRVEQTEKGTKLILLDNKLGLIEYTVKALDNRVSSIGDRVLSINRRLDSKGSDKSGDKEVQ